jgi:hypothetical protein
MPLFFTPVHVLIATIIGFLVGAVWFSPVLFMKAWLFGEGVTTDAMPKRSKQYMLTINLYSLIAHSAMASVLAILFEILMVNTLKGAVSLGLLLAFGFIATVKFIDMIYTTKGKHYEKQSQIKFLVSTGYYIVVVAVMSTVLFFAAIHQ